MCFPNQVDEGNFKIFLPSVQKLSIRYFKLPEFVYEANNIVL